jgi:rubrerythrin
MSITFNVDEIFEMAEEIERNGARFYREAAGNAKDGAVKKMFTEMAVMEDSHEKIFANMRKELSAAMKEPTVYDPDNQVAMYLQTMADFHGTEGKAAPTQKFTGKESLEEILRAALQAEKNSIAFYVGIKDLVTDNKGREKVQAIIAQEMVHVSTIGRKLQELEKGGGSL